MTWKFFGEWNNIPLFYILFWYDLPVNKKLAKLSGTKRKAVFCVIDRKQHLFFDLQWLSELESVVKNRDSNETLAMLEQFDNEYPVAKEKLLAYYNKNYEDTSDEELLLTFENILSLIHDITPYDQYCMIAEQYHIEMLKTALGQQNAEHLAELCAPSKISATQREELSLIQLAIKKEENKLTDEDVQEYLREYGWLPVFLFGDAWDEDHIKKETIRLIKNGHLNEKEKKLKEFENNRARNVKELYDDLSLDEKTRSLADIMQEISFVRNEAETIVSLGMYVLRPVYSELQRRLSIPEERICTLWPHEVRKSLIDKKDMTEEIDRRLQGVFVETTTEDVVIHLGEKALDIFKEYYKKPQRESAESLKGFGASPGNAQGIVKVIDVAQDMEKFNDGDVLVAEATCIDFVPVMRRASAILTEMGGITSHAAVVSREIGVPCIVGIA